MIAFAAAVAIGIIAGLRVFTSASAVSWAAYLGLVPVDGTWLGWLASPWIAAILTALALAEFVADQLPSTPSRKVPIQFVTRIVVGTVGGAACGLASGSALIGSVAGMTGAIIGTLGGAEARARLAASFGRDRPAALIEDVIALALPCAVLLVLQ
jgi:uncharacterized membrane protein